MPRRFGVFILSHGRPDNVITVGSLARGGYTGPWHLVLDDEDDTAPAYIKKYGAARVLTFAKAAVAETFDAADLSPDRRTVAYARNACFALARELGYDYFLELDDDYYDFQHRYEADGILRWVYPNNLDAVCAAMLDFLEASGAATVAFGQGGDLIGGLNSERWKRKIIRKAMNAFFIKTDARWRFIGRLNEDVNTYVTLAQRGLVFLTTLYVTMNQTDTQQNTGGMTDVYLTSGTYVKSFYPVMMMPSAVKVATMYAEHPRIHHRIDWNAAVPKLLSPSLRKW
jgi:hypothetical protein